MAGKVVNLRRARKAKARDEKRAGAEKKTAPGTAAEKARATLEARRLEGHRRDDDD